jgi:hypothetical protein
VVKMIAESDEVMQFMVEGSGSSVTRIYRNPY